MDRRSFVAGGLALGVFAKPAIASPETLESIYKKLEADPSLVGFAHDLADHTISKGVGRGTPSKRKLSPAAIKLMINFEVSSPSIYTKSLTHPLVPGDTSGLTMGVGYDLGFASDYTLRRDWPKLSAADRAILSPAFGQFGDNARKVQASVRSITIPWPDAYAQFMAFLGYPAENTESTLQNCAELPDDSFGALVSLVYNRGTSMKKPTPGHDSRKEMIQIREAMASREFEKIPPLIVAMKRIWAGPKACGLLYRRDAEATLFAQGLRNRIRA